jgi:anti-anti-sigma factor
VNIATVSVERRDTGPVVHVRGQIDLPNSDAVRADILATVPINGPGMILDLTQTTYVESSGVRLFFEVAEHLQARGQRLVLVVAQDALIRRVVALTKLDNVVAIVATVDEALTALQEV